MNIPSLSIRNSSLVWLLIAFVVFSGLLSFSSISRREDPEVKISVALVITIWPGASAEQVEQLVTAKIEEQVTQISDIEKVSSTTRDNISVVFVDAAFNSDIDMVWQKLRNKVQAVKQQLPKNIIGPDIKDDFGDVTSMIWSLSSDHLPAKDLSYWAEQLKYEFQKIESVGKIELWGEQEEVVYIEGPLDTFTLYKFSPLTAAKLLDYQNVNTPAGYIRTDNNKYRLETAGSFNVVDAIKEAVIEISRKTGHPLRVGDVFNVRRAYREPPNDIMLTNGSPTVALDLRMRQGYNVVAMGEQVRKVADEFKKRLPAEVNLTLAHDQPRHVDDFINEFIKNLIEGLLLVVFVIFFAMGLRSAAIVAISLPLSIIGTLAVMPLMGVDLEMISIASFIIALGMLVDNAIIVTDNIYSHLEKGVEPVQAAITGTQEIIFPVITGTLATVVAFLPLLMLQEEIGAFIRSLPLVVSASLLFSLVFAVSMTPILAARFLRVSPKNNEQVSSTSFQIWYARFMEKALQIRHGIISVAIICLLGSMALLPVVGLSFFPQAYRDQFTIDIWLPEGAALADTQHVVTQVHKILAKEKNIVSTTSYIGRGGPRFHITVKPVFNTSNYAQVMVNTNHPATTIPMVKKLNKEFHDRIAGARVTANSIYYGIPVEAPIALRISGPDADVLSELSQTLQHILKGIPGTTQVRDNLGEEIASLKVNVDTEAAMMFGVTNTEVALGLLSAYEGFPVTKMRQGDDEIQIYMRLTPQERSDMESLSAISIPSSMTGAKVPLSAMATIEPQWDLGIYKRHNGQRAITVLADTEGLLPSEVMRDVWPAVKKVSLPLGYYVESVGEEMERNKAFGELILVFVVIILLLLLMLMIQFGSMRRSLVVLFSVPLAIIGAVIGLLVSGSSFSFMAFLGVVSLAGIVIKNAVVWVEFVERALADGQDMEAAIISAGQQRLRPILLTAITTIGGLLPLAIFGGILWEGMAWAMIFGLGLATVLTLVVIPVIYYSIMKSIHNKHSNQAGNLHRGVKVSTICILLVSLWPSSVMADNQHPLFQYLSMADQQAIMIKRAQNDLEQARAQKSQAIASFSPQLELSARVTRLDKAQTLNFDDIDLGIPLDVPPYALVDQQIYLGSAKVTLPLLVGGQRIFFHAAAREGLQARKDALQATKRGMQLATAAYYIQLLQADRIVAVHKETLALDQKLVTVAEAKVAAAMGVQFDLDYAATMAADSERKLTMAQGNFEEQVQEFNHHLNRPLTKHIDLQELTYSHQVMDWDTNSDDMIHARPKLRAMKKGIAAQQAMIKATWGKLLPTVALVGEGGYKKGDFGYVEGDGYYMLTAALTWNGMFDPVSWMKIKEERLKLKRLETDFQYESAQVTLQISKAQRLLHEMETVFEVAKRGVETAKQGLANASKAYEQGVIPINQTIDAARALASAKLGYIQAYYGRILAELQLRYESMQPIITAEHCHTTGSLFE